MESSQTTAVKFKFLALMVVRNLMGKHGLEQFAMNVPSN